MAVRYVGYGKNCERAQRKVPIDGKETVYCMKTMIHYIETTTRYFVISKIFVYSTSDNLDAFNGILTLYSILKDQGQKKRCSCADKELEPFKLAVGGALL